MADDDSKGEPIVKGTIDAAVAFLDKEKDYVENQLRIGHETFFVRLQVHNKLNLSVIKDDEINKLFGNFETLYVQHQQIFDDLTKLRLKSVEELRDGLGAVFSKYVPYFAQYTDYIVKSKDALPLLEKLKKKNKSFQQFLLINETCVGKTLKEFIEAPNKRLPQYLENLASVYTAYQVEGKRNEEGCVQLEKAIEEIRKKLDIIAEKCKDLKAKRLMVQLQNDIFKNKINMLARHRYIVYNESNLKIIDPNKNNKKLKELSDSSLILCNDILLVASKHKLIAVYPLIGLKVSKENPEISESNEKKDDSPLFVISTENKDFQSDDNISSITIICEKEDQVENWIEVINHTVDIEEHNLRPCNPIDLEKRIRKQKVSTAGTQETITITDQKKIDEIENWKNNKDKIKPTPKVLTGKKRKRRVPSKPVPKKPNKPPPTRHSIASTVSTDSITAPPGKKPPPPKKTAAKPPPRKGGVNTSSHNIRPPPPSSAKAKTPDAPSNDVISHTQSLPPSPPKKATPTSQKLKFAPKKKPPAKKSKAIVRSQSSVVSPGGKPSFLSGIVSFEKDKGLKKVDTTKVAKDKKDSGQTEDGKASMNQLLHKTLANYRQFVMDDDASSESDTDWND